MTQGVTVSTALKVTKAMLSASFIERHATGSHVILRHISAFDQRVTVALNSCDFKTGTMRIIIKQSGLTVKKFRKLL